VCASDADCRAPNGPGINKCTNGGLFAGPDAIYSTPICMSLTNCDPGTDGNAHFCDGPDVPTSPGICLSTGTAGRGICLPKCTIPPSGGPPAGCAGNDACYFVSYMPGQAEGVGYCFGGCRSDADCAKAGTGQHCQANEGICVRTVLPVQPTGTGCNVNTANTTTSCNCLSDPTTGLGYCTTFCVEKQPSCSPGYVCETNVPTTAGLNVGHPGLAGYCAKSCASDAGGACPPNSTCQAGTVWGPDCL
jgi:hypothetical protein